MAYGNIRGNKSVTSKVPSAGRDSSGRVIKAPEFPISPIHAIKSGGTQEVSTQPTKPPETPENRQGYASGELIPSTPNIKQSTPTAQLLQRIKNESATKEGITRERIQELVAQGISREERRQVALATGNPKLLPKERGGSYKEFTLRRTDVPQEFKTRAAQTPQQVALVSYKTVEQPQKTEITPLTPTPRSNLLGLELIKDTPAEKTNTLNVLFKRVEGTFKDSDSKTRYKLMRGEPSNRFVWKEDEQSDPVNILYKRFEKSFKGADVIAKDLQLFTAYDTQRTSTPSLSEFKEFRKQNYDYYDVPIKPTSFYHALVPKNTKEVAVILGVNALGKFYYTEIRSLLQKPAIQTATQFKTDLPSKTSKDYQRELLDYYGGKKGEVLERNTIKDAIIGSKNEPNKINVIKGIGTNNKRIDVTLSDIKAYGTRSIETVDKPIIVKGKTLYITEERIKVPTSELRPEAIIPGTSLHDFTATVKMQPGKTIKFTDKDIFNIKDVLYVRTPGKIYSEYELAYFRTEPTTSYRMQLGRELTREPITPTTQKSLIEQTINKKKPKTDIIEALYSKKETPQPIIEPIKPTPQYHIPEQEQIIKPISDIPSLKQYQYTISTYSIPQIKAPTPEETLGNLLSGKKKRFAIPFIEIPDYTTPQTIRPRTSQTLKTNPIVIRELQIITGQKHFSIQTPIVNTAQIQNQGQIQRQEQIQRQQQIQRQEQIQQQIQTQEQIQQQIQEQIQITEPIRITRLTPTNRGISKRFVQDAPDTFKIAAPFITKLDYGEGFDVFVRRRGKFLKINRSPLDRIDAMNMGSFKVGNTSAATFKILPAPGRIDSTFKLKGKLEDFYKPKNQPDTFIERASRRIKSTGEKLEITYKGIQANRKSLFRIGK